MATILFFLFFVRLIDHEETWKYTNLLQCLRTTSVIIAGAYSYSVVSSFKCEEKMVAMT